MRENIRGERVLIRERKIKRKKRKRKKEREREREATISCSRTWPRERGPGDVGGWR